MALPTKAPQSNEGLITAQNQMEVVKNWGEQFTALTTTQKVILDQTEKEFGMSIITNLTDRCITAGIKIDELNLTNFLEQVKHYSKLQLSINEQELYLDIRNDKNTGLKTVKISKQYQGIEKLMCKYCKKKIVRFKRGIVCKGDEFEVVEDFDLGITKIKKHVINPQVDRNNLINIEKAYDIAYVEEYGKLVPYTVIVEKNRIIRAKNAATTDKVWVSDTQKMVLKTAAWELWALMKPYIEFPIGLQESFVETDDEMNWDKPFNPNVVDEYTIDVEDNNSNSAPKEEKVEEVVVETQQANDEADVQYIDYAVYKNNKDEWVRCPYLDGTDPYNRATGKIRVKHK